MAPSREAFHADAKETSPLVGVGQEALEAEAAPAAVSMEEYFFLDRILRQFFIKKKSWRKHYKAKQQWWRPARSHHEMTEVP